VSVLIPSAFHNELHAVFLRAWPIGIFGNGRRMPAFGSQPLYYLRMGD
jgi:hypothetical protein